MMRRHSASTNTSVEDVYFRSLDRSGEKAIICARGRDTILMHGTALRTENRSRVYEAGARVAVTIIDADANSLLADGRATIMKPYTSPVLSDYGSIADSTFATPAAGGDPEQPGGGPFVCHSTLAGSGQPGTKSQTVLQCDKFGEYSHS